MMGIFLLNRLSTQNMIVTMMKNEENLQVNSLTWFIVQLRKKAGKNVGLGKWNYIRSHTMRKYFNSTLLNAGANSFFTEFLMRYKLDDT